MNKIYLWGIAVLVIVLVASLGPVAAQDGTDLSAEEQLGKSILFVENLSINQNQSCASCHGPGVGWTGPIAEINTAGGVYEGSIDGRFGDRKPPSAAYATPSPIFHVDKKGVWVGGNFWDGRATGEVLGKPAADQARGPFLNPVEQALPDSACVVYRVSTNTDYPVSFEDVWGTLDIVWSGNVDANCAAGATIDLDSDDRAKSDAAYDLSLIHISEPTRLQ